MTDTIRRVAAEFDRAALARVCAMRESSFRNAYGMTRQKVNAPAPANYYLFKDNGADILAVAHLDTVADHSTRAAHYLDTAGGTVVYSRALDDRLGAYIVAELLPRLGITCDVLFTVGEEMGMSTAEYFDAPREYNWVIEFDRGGSDVVMYQYDDAATRALVKDSGAAVGTGSFSDIAYLEHLGVKAFNWGTGYRDYHGPRSHAYLDDTFAMVARFVRFHADNADTRLPHHSAPRWSSKYASGVDSAWGRCEFCPGGIYGASGYCVTCDTCADCFEDRHDCHCKDGAGRLPRLAWQ